jgi:hypothetical protein
MPSTGNADLSCANEPLVAMATAASIEGKICVHFILRSPSAGIIHIIVRLAVPKLIART